MAGTLAARADVVELVNNLPPHVLLVMDEAYIEYAGLGMSQVKLIKQYKWTME